MCVHHWNLDRCGYGICRICHREKQFVNDTEEEIDRIMTRGASTNKEAQRLGGINRAKKYAGKRLLELSLIK